MAQDIDRKMVTIKRMAERIITINPDMFSKNGCTAVVHIATCLSHRSHNRMYMAEASLVAACRLADDHHMLACTNGFGDDAIYWLVYAANLMDCDYTYTQWYQSSIAHVMDCLDEVYILERQHEQM